LLAINFFEVYNNSHNNIEEGIECGNVNIKYYCQEARGMLHADLETL
jgi:hypothetical protein